MSSLDESLKLLLLDRFSGILPQLLLDFLEKANVSNLLINFSILIMLYISKKYWIKYINIYNLLKLYNPKFVSNKKSYDYLIYVTYTYVFWRM